MLQPHPWTSFQGCQQLGTAIPSCCVSSLLSILLFSRKNPHKLEIMKKTAQKGKAGVKLMIPSSTIPLSFKIPNRDPKKKPEPSLTQAVF